MPILCDYHMHTPRCKHAAGPLEAYVDRALTLGLRELGFACHNPLPDGRGANVRMAEAELPAYVADVLALRARFRDQIEIRLGLEMDYVVGLEEYLQRQATAYPWDYVIGSIHYLEPTCRRSSWPRHDVGDIHALYAQYFALLQQMVRTGFYDIVAHFDVPKRTGHAPGAPERAAIRATLQTIATAGVALEINTSGYRHVEPPRPEPYPSFPIVTQALALGIPFTVNSDAHAPDQVGTMFPEIERFLRAQGCRQLWRFANRQRTAYAL